MKPLLGQFYSCNIFPGFTPIGQLDFTDGLERGPRPPASRAECEALMMIGLPGAGKTFWAEKQRQERPEKNYNILGTNNLIDKVNAYHSPFNLA